MKYRRARQTAWRTIADETVLLDLERKRMYGLNPAAARIWLALEAAENAGELLQMTVGEAKPSFGEDDVTAFLDQLASLKLIEALPRDAAEPVLDAEPLPVESEDLEPPKVLWQEEVEQIAGTCAMFPSTSPICDQAPFS